MNLENSIKDVITTKLEDGTVEKLIGEELEKGVTNALNNLFRSYGDVTKIIEEKVKSVMVPYLENYDYSEYITKLDSVLVDVLNSSALDNKKILENFQGLMSYKAVDEIKVTQLFDKWQEYASKNIDTSDLELSFDDGVSYGYVETSFEIEYEEDRSWSNIKYAKIVFECEKDNELNLEIKITNYNGNGWKLDYRPTPDIRSLRRLDAMELLLMNLYQSYTTIIIDKDWGEGEIEVDAEPEASFS